ncbi:GAF domain-containing protein [Streptomyces sp. NPDC051985]|uniref:GAF domain-containing protein n=1 Tax=Streptomyces sp. NPDC051985 TaxID=3155807 RepID=UPI003434A8BF
MRLTTQTDVLAGYLTLALDEPAAVQHVRDAAAELHAPLPLSTVLPRITGTAMALTGAEFGNIQVTDPRDGSLVLVTQSGFHDGFLDHFAVVRDTDSVCGQASQQHAQAAVADVREDRTLTRHQDVFRAAGVRAVLSTPLVDRTGRIVGMVSTHASQPGLPPERDLRIVELYARLAGEMVADRLYGSPAARTDTTGFPYDGTALSWTSQSSVDPPIRRVLSDTINRIFATGLNLAGTLSLVLDDGVTARRVLAGLDELDEAIHQIQRAALTLDSRDTTGIDGSEHDRHPCAARTAPGR